MRRGLVLAVAALASWACASSRAVPDRGDIVRRTLPSTVQLRAEREGGSRRTASGVVLAADAATGRSWIVTTRHFLDPPLPQQVWARRPGRSEALPVGIVARNDDVDLAILVVEGVALPPVALKAEAALGDEVLVLAFPWGRRLTVVSGIVSQLSPGDSPSPWEGRPRMVDASVSYGSSGGGVFDGVSGALIAIVEGYRTAKVMLPDAPDRTFEVPVAGETTVIPAQAIHEFLLRFGLEPFLAR